MTDLLNRLLQYRIVRFILTGGMATAIHIAVAFLFLHFIQDNVLYANVCGFTIAFFFSYFAQTLIVFKNKVNWGNAVRFFTVQFASLMVAQSISALFSDVNSYIRVLIVVVILPIITYLVHKIWTFSEPNDTATKK
ncbi:GtrA family protein [Vibrio mediterranei]|uniref:GtrA family protein n=1 Tax=Vibrio TaxID=662 RepID=UPI0018425336|nr:MULTISPECIES: GtrA family protein [Vibrio]MDA0110558.1 GtrA family protein [Vibrio sp. La 4.2.2]NUW73851.1 GtrA family protein [Vibrio mediterranei]